MTTSDRYESLAAQWQANGQPPSALLAGYRLIALRCWVTSTGGTTEGVSDRLRAYLRASEDACHPGWLDDYLSEREACKGCGDHYCQMPLSAGLPGLRRNALAGAAAGRRARVLNHLTGTAEGRYVDRAERLARRKSVRSCG